MKQCFDEGSYATQSVNIEEFNSRGTGYGDDHVNAMSLYLQMMECFVKFNGSDRKCKNSYTAKQKFWTRNQQS